MRRLRTALLVLAATGALLTTAAPTGSAGTSTEESHHPKPTVVLVHGAFADASSWSETTTRLQRQGYTVVAPATPLRGLTQDADYIASVIKSIPGPVVLVGHSYGGAVISTAAASLPQVKALVYVAAFVPDTGEVLGELAGRFPGSELVPALKPIPHANGADLYIDPAKFRHVFTADLSPSTSALLAASQRPINATLFGDAAPAAAWRTIPSWAVIAKQDRAISPDLERFEAKRANSKTIELNSSHVPMLSHPDEVTRVITTAARATTK
ncbi:alpha/beta fold hydrolase [Actinokineospora globicatena]|uniref:alpha/beta fold hydrolase n=1 Tax=Actinokineospora globicatena TaxID=103729 RepID=UPI0020A37517|nr:alpha/beta hydrolase [Actinokineospora globicatena]MCP2304493.1 Pimeloyl-ACP methyl ester carboxylesterase [Actinokineospora globicatena]GLW78141.1 alpha/beta hydrolase [Actinokineospora globicatena]GLW85193.1 alpha/beta hydrolase [Actinokineospora globicatena]